jgi:hypothetical protein
MHRVVRFMGAFGRPVINLRQTADGFDPGRVDGEDMRPMFLSLEARQTVEYLLELMQYSPPNVLSMNWYDRAVAYQRGHVALAYSHTMLAPRPPVPAISHVVGIAGQQVHDLLSGTKSIGAALRDAQNRADARMRELGYY